MDIEIEIFFEGKYQNPTRLIRRSTYLLAVIKTGLDPLHILNNSRNDKALSTGMRGDILYIYFLYIYIYYIYIIYIYYMSVQKTEISCKIIPKPWFRM